MSLAKMMVIGNLGQDPQLRYTPQGTPVASFPLCANERTRNGKKQHWFDVNLFGNNAESVMQYSRKGDTVYVEGREDIQLWTKRSGETAVSRKLNTNNVDFIKKGPAHAAAESQAAPAGTAEAAPESPADLSDDDIPF